MNSAAQTIPCGRCFRRRGSCGRMAVARLGRKTAEKTPGKEEKKDEKKDQADQAEDVTPAEDLIRAWGPATHFVDL